LFNRLYQLTMRWSRAPRAPWYLAGLSFAESSFFPIPPDVMLAPMSLAQPQRAWNFAFITTVASVLGGVFGYAIGYFAFESIEPWLRDSHYWDGYLKARAWFDDWGFWAVFVAGFSPIPYKVFTIAAGSLSMALGPFVLASLIGRGARFYLVAGLLAWGGPRMEQALERYVEWLGWAVVGILIAAYLILQG
ncbi:MAG: YqaA family protein, partial [Gammaproteobacteria bacterium]